MWNTMCVKNNLGWGISPSWRTREIHEKSQELANIPQIIVMVIIIFEIIIIYMAHGQCYIVLSSQLNCALFYIGWGLHFTAHDCQRQQQNSGHFWISHQKICIWVSSLSHWSSDLFLHKMEMHSLLICSSIAFLKSFLLYTADMKKNPQIVLKIWF